MSETRLYAWVKGPEGCDYSIGCGVDVRQLEATTIEAAILEACGTAEEGPANDERVTDINIVLMVASCGGRLEELRAENKRQVDARKLATKRAELARLKHELGET
jgi:hypothetical protein